MRQEVYMHFRYRPELIQFIRQHPYWYRWLSRNPYRFKELEKAADQFYGKTMPQRVEKLQNNIQLIMMLIQMFQMNMFGDQNQPVGDESSSFS